MDASEVAAADQARALPRAAGVAVPMRQGAWLALAVGALLAIAYPLPFQLTGRTYFITVGFLVILYAMLGVGWNVIGGWAGQFDFGPQVFFGIGAYTEAVLAARWQVNAWLGMLAGALLAVVVAVLVTYPITRLRGHYFAIATVAVWMIAQPIARESEFLNRAEGIFIPLKPAATLAGQVAGLQFTGATKELGYYYVCLALLGLTLLGAGLVERSKLGYSFKAVRDDQDAAEAIGVNSRFYKVLARCVTATVYAVGGALFGQWALSVLPDQVLSVDWGVIPTLAVVLGGIGRLWGAVLGALILIPLSQLMSTYLATGALASRGIDLIVYGIIIMVVAALRPQGLLSLPWGRWFERLAGRG